MLGPTSAKVDLTSPRGNIPRSVTGLLLSSHKGNSPANSLPITSVSIKKLPGIRLKALDKVER